MMEGRRSEKNINYVSFLLSLLDKTVYSLCKFKEGGFCLVKGNESWNDLRLYIRHEFICTTNLGSCGEESYSPDESADGQLALGMTGGRTLSNNKGRPPPMLGLRCGIDALDEACDGSTGSCANCFSNLANSSSSCAISRRYTRFCTSTRYWSSLLHHEI